MENPESVAEKAHDGDPAPSAQRARLERSREAPLGHCFKLFWVYEERGDVGKSLTCPPSSPSRRPCSSVQPRMCEVPPWGQSVRCQQRRVLCRRGDSAILVTEGVPQAHLHSPLNGSRTYLRSWTYTYFMF